jgi:hypothetical protein
VRGKVARDNAFGAAPQHIFEPKYSPANRRPPLGALGTDQPGKGAGVVEDQDSKANQDDWGDDMAIVTERCSEFGMIDHPMRKQAPQSRHYDKYRSYDRDLPSRVDREGRHVNADVVATIGYGYKRHTGNTSVPSSTGKPCLNGLMTQRNEFPDADQDGKYTEKTKISIGNHEREQSPNCTHHKQDREPQVLSGYYVSGTEPGMSKQRDQHHKVVHIGRDK